MNATIQKRDAVAGTATWCLAVLLAVVGANLAASGSLRNTAVIVAGFVGLILLLRPVLALWFIIIGGLVLAGVTQLYAPQLQFVRWSIGLLASLLGAIALCKYFFQEAGSRRKYLPPLFWWMAAFLAVAVVSGLLNYRNANTLLFGFKGYFQAWGLFFALLMMGWSEKTVNRISKVLIGIAFLQVPFALHEYLYLVPGRRYLGNGVVAEDVVAGTLGASPTGGGANAVLSAVLLITVAILVSLYKRKRMSWRGLFGAVVILLVPVVLNANKIALVYLIIIFLMLFSRELWRKPISTLLIGMVSAVFFSAILWSYTTLLSRSDEDRTWQSYIEQAVIQNTSRTHGHGGYALNRWTAVSFWVDEHRGASLDKLFFGHGVGAARDGGDGAFDVRTLASGPYAGMGIGLTTISAVLWEMGLVGLILLFGIFWAAVRSAGWLVRYYEADAWKAAVFEGLRVGVVILGIGWFFQASFVFLLPYQTLFLLIVGYLGYWHAKAIRGSGRSERNQPVADSERQTSRPATAPPALESQ